jgi:hypothetical protein
MDELVVHGPVNVGPLGRGTHLTGVEISGPRHALSGASHIDIVETPTPDPSRPVREFRDE